MITLRLQRIGRKNDPHFRVVATDSKHPTQTGKFIEIVGTFDVKKGVFNAKKDRVLYWISVGAQTSATLNNLLITHKIIEGEKRRTMPAKKKEKAKKK